MKILEVQKKCNISQSCLRFYERIGLLPRINRDKHGIRNYTEKDLKWLKFIKCMKKARISTELLIEYTEVHKQEDNVIKYAILQELNSEIENETSELMHYKKIIEEKLLVLKEKLENR